ncbi:hypothetical protein QBC43DRAFT_222016 [Cladorrhinum sp. PSN259]|nr:hypothetical protein QBC43DRAFT_222016 [Cladorrhinum sp. PSN259]
MTSLLDELRGLSTVDCDTLDPEGKTSPSNPLTVPERLGPLGDCTSNQAIAYAELSKIANDGNPVYQQLIIESVEVAHWMFGKQSDATIEELAVELMMVGLSLRMAPHTTGFLHVQTNPKHAYSAEKTIKNAERIVSHFRHLAPDFDPQRICIKVPCTWEGLQACRQLAISGITTLATIVFCLEQAMTAAEVGCRYVAPYVNELRVHFEQGYIDPNKDSAINLCGQIQQSFELSQWNRTTPQVVAASLTSINEIMQLAGVKHITISPPLLAELAATPAADWKGARPGGIFPTKLPEEASYEDQMHTLEHRNMGRYLVADEEVWRMKVTRSDEGRSEQKLIQAINIFCDMQDKLEEIVREADVLIQGGKA